MMTRSSKLFRLYACISFFVLGVPVLLKAQYGYTVSNGTVTVINYTGPGGPVVIPSTIGNLPVTSVGYAAFRFSSNVTSVVIPSSVTSIGDSAFFYAIGLTNVIFDNSITDIGSYAFSGCSGLTSVTLPGSLAVSGSDIFSFCTGLTNVTIGNGIANIGYRAFSDCTSLTRVSIPDSVTSIGNSAFFEDMGLTNVTIGGGTTNIGNGAFQSCTNLTWIYFKGNRPSAVGNFSFYGVLSATAYYLPGTTGWGTNFGNYFWNLPTALWNPQVQSDDASFGMRMNRFGFNINGTADIPIVIEASDDLAARSWVLLQSSTLTNGSFYFSDNECTNYARRFYRIRSP